MKDQIQMMGYFFRVDSGNIFRTWDIFQDIYTNTQNTRQTIRFRMCVSVRVCERTICVCMCVQLFDRITYAGFSEMTFVFEIFVIFVLFISLKC